jgi:tRNA (adenine57-N1/adenine58-N1)-methyltransferase
MYESLMRPHETQPLTKPLHISEITKQLAEAEKRKETRRIRQMEEAKRRNNAKKRKLEDLESEEPNGATSGAEDQQSLTSQKRLKNSVISGDSALHGPLDTKDEEAVVEAEINADDDTQVVSRVSAEVRGHTSYLTFALYLPYPFPTPSAEETG